MVARSHHSQRRAPRASQSTSHATIGLKSIMPIGGSTRRIGSTIQLVEDHDGPHPAGVRARCRATTRSPARRAPSSGGRRRRSPQTRSRRADPSGRAPRACTQSPIEPLDQADQKQPADDDDPDEPERGVLRVAAEPHDSAARAGAAIGSLSLRTNLGQTPNGLIRRLRTAQAVPATIDGVHERPTTTRILATRSRLRGIMSEAG